MDIGLDKSGAAKALSNLTPHPFKLRGQSIASPEGCLQGLKVAAPGTQQSFWKLVGHNARKAGQSYNWKRDGYLYWQGKRMYRFGNCYQRFLNEMYLAIFLTNEKYRTTLLSTAGQPLTHKLAGGKTKKDTVLTEREFVGRLTWIRDYFAPLARSSDFPTQIAFYQTHHGLVEVLTDMPLY